MVESLESFIFSRSVFKVCEKLEGLLVKPWGITVQVNWFFFPDEGKIIG